MMFIGVWLFSMAEISSTGSYRIHRCLESYTDNRYGLSCRQLNYTFIDYTSRGIGSHTVDTFQTTRLA